MRSSSLSSFFLAVGFASYFAISATAQTISVNSQSEPPVVMKDVSGNIVAPCDKAMFQFPQGKIAVCPSGLTFPGCADRAAQTESEKIEHSFFSGHPELFPEQYVTGTHANIIIAYNKSGCDLKKFGQDYPQLTPAGFFEDLNSGDAGVSPPPQPISGGGQCMSARGREKDPLHNPDNPGSTDTKPKLVPEPCGNTYDTYYPPAIACGEKGGIPGVWARVNRNGDVTGQLIGNCLTNAPGGYLHDCSLQNQCANSPPKNVLKQVYVKGEDPQPSTENLVQSGVGDRYLSGNGEIKMIRLNHFTSLNVNRYDFATGLFSNDQGEQFRDGVRVAGSGSGSFQFPPGDLGAQCAPTPNPENNPQAAKAERKCLKQLLHDNKPELKTGPGRDGLGKYGCGTPKTGSRTAQALCLRDLLRGDCVQRLPGFPPVGNCNGTPPPISRVEPAQQALDQAIEKVVRVQAELQSLIAKRQEAEQQINTAKTTLTKATAERETAEQQLAAANTAFESAAAVVNQAEQILQQSLSDQTNSEQQLTTAQAEVASAEAALQEALQAAKHAHDIERKRISEENRRAAEEAARLAEIQAAKMAADLAAAKRKSEAEKAAAEAAKRRAELLEQIAAAERKRQAAEEEARQAAEQAEREVAEQAAAQAKEQAAQQKAALSSAQTASSDARAKRQAAEQAVQDLRAQAASGDSAAQLAVKEAEQKAEEAKLAFTRAAEEANLAAEQAAQEAAEKAAQLAADLAAAQEAEAQAIALEEAAAALAKQAEDHAAQIQQTWRF